MEIIKNISNPFWWVEKCMTDLYFECRNVLQILEDPTIGLKDLYYPTHKRMCDFAEKNALEGHKLLILCPRNWLKSYIYTVGWTMQRLIRNWVHRRQEHIIISNATGDNAKEFLWRIKYNLLYNDFLRGILMSTIPGLSEQLDDPENKAERWTQGEIQILGNRVDTGSVEGNLVSRHFKVMINDDLVSLDNSRTREQLAKTIDWWKLARSLLLPSGIELSVGCLTADSRVLMATGEEKRIIDVEVGERVMSFMRKPGFGEGLKPQKVEAVIPQGEAEVFEVKTRNRKLEATANHPFLTTTRGFVRLDELKIGDKIKVAHYLDVCKYRQDLSEEEMWAFGYMLGDGWLIDNKGRYGICISKGVDEKLNNRFINFFTNKFPTSSFYETDFGYYRSDSKAPFSYYKKLGFCGKAKTKRVPPWIYSLTTVLKESFLDGFIDADGWVQNKSKCIELSNKNLVLDIKRLAESCGYKVSNVHTRTRMSQPPNSPVEIEATSHHIGIGYRRWKKGVRWERVLSITPKGKKEVYDLTVANTHNFVGNGFIIHNTRWDYDDLYGHIIERFLKPGKDYSVGKPIVELHRGNFHLMQMDCWEDVDAETGSTYPVLFPEWKLKELQEEQEEEFYGQYRNDPLKKGKNKYKREDFHYYVDGDIPSIVNTVFLLDVTDKDKNTSDYTGLTVADLGCDKKGYIRAGERKKVTDGALIEWLIEIAPIYQPSVIGIETTKYATILELMEFIIKKKFALGEVPSGYKDFVKTMPYICHELKHRGRPKKIRVENMHGYVQRGIILFPRSGADCLIDELLRFGSSKVDDTADSFGYLFDVLEFPEKTDPPKALILPDKLKMTQEEREKEDWSNYLDDVYESGVSTNFEGIDGADDFY